ncbi:MAG: hypothetical protein VR68_09380 [Peptococcaceae bacterium BRH_c4a]|nr:MAG: hypothetical protein VR68_09380 [Peptococcaceae bacterium BRH_c4a]
MLELNGVGLLGLLKLVADLADAANFLLKSLKLLLKLYYLIHKIISPLDKYFYAFRLPEFSICR